ncbi:phytanoyl-CoA dioxygenase family protein [Sneathiella marina]|uniref:Phytanoyl-CoA dioxygenase family protein n=1 Tax=Sneathiella marina TaxID=2950108 RepID=A0ABY4W4T8_9PROT|nr:phytanoyl-CoA dioxygenase family protein [Sneathiella marina]USG59651.1 phytanoyl-CoA dioxygenase family protein [Sneathiella marina]
MTVQQTSETLSADEHAREMADYIAKGEKLAHGLENRGPIRLDENGKLAADILQAYETYGFYVFESVIDDKELEELRSDVEQVLSRAPVTPEATKDSQGRAALGPEYSRYPFRFAKPLSDPLGGTDKNKGRHPVKMRNPAPNKSAPDWTIELLLGNLHLMDSCLRLYGHPKLLAAAEAVNGPDFVPYNEVTFIKEPGLGPSVAWHQDGTTHWDAPDWDQFAHGFNFMAQLYPSTPGNGVWVLPGSQKSGKVNISKLVEESGSERIDGAVPLVCKAGDVFMVNRQMVHGSFANSSADRRITLNAGFFPRRRVLGVKTSQLDGTEEAYDADRINERSRTIAIASDARQQKFPQEHRYSYQPLKGAELENSWSEDTRRNCLLNYNLRDIYI